MGERSSRPASRSDAEGCTCLSCQRNDGRVRGVYYHWRITGRLAVRSPRQQKRHAIHLIFHSAAQPHLPAHSHHNRHRPVFCRFFHRPFQCQKNYGAWSCLHQRKLFGASLFTECSCVFRHLRCAWRNRLFLRGRRDDPVFHQPLV